MKLSNSSSELTFKIFKFVISKNVEKIFKEDKENSKILSQNVKKDKIRDEKEKTKK